MKSKNFRRYSGSAFHRLKGEGRSVSSKQGIAIALSKTRACVKRSKARATGSV